jgi:hypothetical protein
LTPILPEARLSAVGRGKLTAAVALVALACAAATAVAAGDPWPAAHARLSYTIYKPSQALGDNVSGFGYQPCPGGKSKASIYATYGTYKGVLSSKVKGFGIFEGSPAICSDHAEFWPVGTRIVGGAKATLGVYCGPPKHCPISQGPRNGWIMLWTRGKTRIQLDGVHISQAQLLKVANGLQPVK